ncbi:hypothetical protein [Paenibacillus taihuensis]|uniref:hypothetical protein n=1 Tax=Paenibacillus taihuensis TaxID=1156355 RepID=UPI000E2864F7|nr:hypothetical protein [Paenibacillus taihuensis]
MTIVAEIFASVDSSIFYTAYLLSYVVPADSYDVREFFIAGNVTYEVQLDAQSTDGVTETRLPSLGSLVS